MERQDLTDEMVNHNRAGQGEGGEVVKVKCKMCNRTFECAKHSQSCEIRICSKCFRKMKKEKNPVEEVR